MSTSVQTNNPLKRAVNLNHRFDTSDEDETFDPIDTIAMMSNRALGVLYSLSIQFEGSCESRLSDNLMCGAIDAAIREVEDINASIMAFANFEHAKRTHKKDE